jgi:hypothetical protein
MTPDPSFVRDLKAYDPLLRVRWAVHSKLWFIERKLQVRDPGWLAERPLNPFGTGKLAKDRWAGWRSGHVHVMSVHPSLLHWSQVAPVLVKSDSQQAGSWAALADRMDAADAAMEAERERTVTAWSEAAAKDGADHLYWQAGATVAAPHEPSGVIPSDRVEQHPDGFTIRTRKGAR